MVGWMDLVYSKIFTPQLHKPHTQNVTVILIQHHMGFIGFPTSTKAGIDEDSPQRNAVRGNHHVLLEGNSYQNKSLFTVSPRKTSQGLREHVTDNPSMTGLRADLMQGR